jgi:hypothetical protein
MYAGRNATKNCYKEIPKRWYSCITLLLLLVLFLILDTTDEPCNSTHLLQYYLQPLPVLAGHSQNFFLCSLKSRIFTNVNRQGYFSCKFSGSWIRLRSTMSVSVEIFSGRIWVHFSCLGKYCHNRSWGSRSSGIQRCVMGNLRPTFRDITVSCLQRSEWRRHSTVKDEGTMLPPNVGLRLPMGQRRIPEERIRQCLAANISKLIR